MTNNEQNYNPIVKAWNWLFHAKDNTSSVTDVMDDNGNFTYKDNSNGFTQLWNGLIGKSARDYNTAVSNYTNQYNSPEYQRKLYEKAGLNVNLLGNGGVQSLADTSAIGLNGSTFNDAFQNIGSIWNMAKGINDIFAMHKSNKLRNKGLSLDNIAKELGMPEHKLNNAIYTFMNNPDQLQKQLDSLSQEADNRLSRAGVDATSINNDNLEQGNRTVKIMIDSLRDAVAEGQAHNDYETMLIKDDNGNFHLNDKYAKMHSTQRDDAYNSAHYQALNNMADNFRKNAEKSFYTEYGKYPDWNIDFFDEQSQKALFSMIQDSSMKDWQKTLLFTVITMSKSKMGM